MMLVGSVLIPITKVFAELYSPWQRGCNKNINGLLRQYFPKGSDFTIYSDKDVEIAVREINNRSRKTLNYRTFTEVIVM